MESNQKNRWPHLILNGTTKTERFKSQKAVVKPPALPALDRLHHGHRLLDQINLLKSTADNAREIQENAGLKEGFGLQIQFKSQCNIPLALEKLDRKSGIELLNVRKEKIEDQQDEYIFATVFVPDGKLDVFEKLISEYLNKGDDEHPKNKALINTIDEIRQATLDALWTDDIAELPQQKNEQIWWEVWLRKIDNHQDTLSSFRTHAEKIGFQCAKGQIDFPERTVISMKGTKKQITQSLPILNSIAELRRVKETAEFFDSLMPIDQSDWVSDLISRIQLSNNKNNPYICILDTGINNGHPLLQSIVYDSDLHTIEPDWGTFDDAGHGTEMAGLALFGDLTEVLESNQLAPINYRVESVKLLRGDGDNHGRQYGDLTTEAIARPESRFPERSRVFSMAITAKDNRDRGRPSAWSAALDKLATDYDGDGLTPRLIIVSAGNVYNNHNWLDYPDSNTSDSIHDPGQAWNVLTVGAYTEKNRIVESNTDGYEAIAAAGALSPFSTTSMIWEDFWPLKPDVLFEGGNVAKDNIGAVSMHSLNLLTTHHKPHERLLTTTNATSAATALCSRMAAQIMANYPYLWPETIRGLIVHSADWTEEMKQTYNVESLSKEQYRCLIRHCGFGVPDIDRALWSISNSLALIIQDSIQPFEKTKSTITTCDMHLHALPWPITELEKLGETPVEMTVTLSYFIEPNPAARQFKGRYCYESHGLRFDVKRPTETKDQFRNRINRLVQEDEGKIKTTSTDSNWLLGTKLRHRGSLHKDTWKGTAADLAHRGILAVYPTSGWWKTRDKLNRYNNKARYALIVSIKAPDVNIDLYTLIQNMIKTPISISSF